MQWRNFMQPTRRGHRVFPGRLKQIEATGSNGSATGPREWRKRPGWMRHASAWHGRPARVSGVARASRPCRGFLAHRRPGSRRHDLAVSRIHSLTLAATQRKAEALKAETRGCFPIARFQLFPALSAYFFAAAKSRPPWCSTSPPTRPIASRLKTIWHPSSS
jgi:hypothetical protein